MKDASIFDGSGWQSLRGPPGPSLASADAGNIITKGSDGLLRVTGETQFSGEWTPVGGGFADGYWTRCGRAVTLIVQFSDGAAIIEGLPFSVAEYYSETSGDSALYSATIFETSVNSGAVGHASIRGGQGDAVGLTYTPQGPAQLCFTITYLTDDPPLR